MSEFDSSHNEGYLEIQHDGSSDNNVQCHENSHWNVQSLTKNSGTKEESGIVEGKVANDPKIINKFQINS